MKITWENPDKARNRAALMRLEQPIIDALCELLGDPERLWAYVNDSDLDMVVALDRHPLPPGWSDKSLPQIDAIAQHQTHTEQEARFTLRPHSSGPRKCSVGRVARQLLRWVQPATAEGFDYDTLACYVGESDGWGWPMRGEVGEVLRFRPFSHEVKMTFPSVGKIWLETNELDPIEEVWV